MFYYCIHELKWTPEEILKVFDDLDQKAFVQACVQLRVEAEIKEQKKLEREMRR